MYPWTTPLSTLTNHKTTIVSKPCPIGTIYTHYALWLQLSHRAPLQMLDQQFAVDFLELNLIIIWTSYF
jgi:hypothetical protein